jgi:hypothetical protein
MGAQHRDLLHRACFIPAIFEAANSAAQAGGDFIVFFGRLKMGRQRTLLRPLF